MLSKTLQVFHSVVKPDLQGRDLSSLMCFASLHKTQHRKERQDGACVLQGSGFDPLQRHKDTNEVKKLKCLLMAKLGRREQAGSEGRREGPVKREGKLRFSQH